MENQKHEENEFSSDSTDINEFKSWCEEYGAAYREKKQLEKRLEEISEKTESLKPKIMEAAEVLGLYELDSGTGLKKASIKTTNGTFTVSEKYYVNQVQGENKEAFFQYLKSKGIFEGMVSVHSQTLNSFVMEEVNAHGGIASGWKPPGIDEIKKQREVRFRLKS